MLSEIDQRAAAKRRNRMLREIEEEEARIAQIEENRKQKLLRERTLAAETKLAEEYARQKAERLTREAEIKRIRETSDEIKELEVKLQAAYMNKERAHQLEEKVQIQEEEHIKDREAELAAEQFEKIRLSREGDPEEKRLKQLEDEKQALEMHKHERELQKQREYEIFLQEKQMVDEAVRQVLEANEREEMERMKKQKEMQQFISEYFKQREESREKERKMIEDENERIRKFTIEKEKREEETERQRKAKEDEQKRLYAQIAATISRDKAEKDELERLRDELVFEEEEAKRRGAEKEEALKRQRMQEEMMRAEEEWKKAKAERVAREAEEDRKMKEAMMQKFAEDERIDQMTAQRRKAKVAEHMREAERLVKLKREQEKAKEAAERAEWEAEQKRQEDRRRLIQEERLRLLKEHAVKLWGYLPKGVIQNEEELAVFPEEMQREYLAQKQMGAKDKVFDNPEDQREYERIYEEDAKKLFPETRNYSGKQQQQSAAEASKAPGLIPGLGGSGTSSRTHPRYRDTRPW
ncbi:putative meiosis-specific nuclear structural protein 1 [Monocercomonoides exilis]|uniref:putative meiosis-specific nuclear structural protein 1 n=1 Tax=Monocercomonoides exilis TaxID=2049356 RepID=UPI003559708A|nr:putative meiosis-specific nuclear structural protein 1 [Monocercomonoides exilis]|eukprot:MONOS_10417.1-p1 / transcript=MONOS_10417.1 / gene=MONOS_10417 / organism=Monocercomonoides_exilis_PA203 / gene_product=meiosis-specific nuclear structural protein 1 / transcript_product=meiosis-specific nuclear structural protein 1 / location=Mono_scaffold00473:45715-47767(-) / protein_length=525 / sequence_SO=supercontig / SO=protein_coding / is_pseudo=false